MNPHSPASHPRAALPWWLLGVLLVVTYLFVVTSSLDKPFTTDEIYYAGWAHGISETGFPGYYQGEILTLNGRTLVEPLAHPPGHFLLLAGMVSVFGLHYWSLRLLGVLLFVAAVLFVHRFVAPTLGWGRDQRLLAALLVVFNPLFLQQTLVLAIEAQAFWFPVLVFLYVFYRETRQARRWFRYPGALLAMVALFWLKETNIVIYVSAAVAWLVLARDWKGLLHFAGAVVAGLGVFWLGWLGFCALSGVDPYSWWQFTVADKMFSRNHKPYAFYHFVLAGDWSGFAKTVGIGLRISTFWLSVPLVGLFLLTLGIRLSELRRTPNAASFVDLCLLYALCVLAFANLVRPSLTFLKYEVPAYPFLALFVADTLYRRLDLRLRDMLWPVLAAATAAPVLWWLAPDRLLASDLGRHALWSAAGLAIVLGAVAARRRVVLRDVAVALLALTVTFNGALYLHQSASYTTGTSWYNYGDQRYLAIDWLAEHMREGDTVAAFKDIQFNVRYLEGKSKATTWEVRVFTRDDDDWHSKRALLASGAVRYLVLDRYSRPRKPIAAIDEHYREVWRRDDLRILEHRGAP